MLIINHMRTTTTWQAGKFHTISASNLIFRRFLYIVATDPSDYDGDHHILVLLEAFRAIQLIKRLLANA